MLQSTYFQTQGSLQEDDGAQAYLVERGVVGFDWYRRKSDYFLLIKSTKRTNGFGGGDIIPEDCVKPARGVPQVVRGSVGGGRRHGGCWQRWFAPVSTISGI